MVPRLVAQREQPSWSNDPVEPRHLRGPPAPEVKDVAGEHKVHRRQGCERTDVPAHKAQPVAPAPGSGAGSVTASRAMTVGRDWREQGTEDHW